MRALFVATLLTVLAAVAITVLTTRPRAMVAACVLSYCSSAAFSDSSESTSVTLEPTMTDGQKDQESAVEVMLRIVRLQHELARDALATPNPDRAAAKQFMKLARKRHFLNRVGFRPTALRGNLQEGNAP